MSTTATYSGPVDQLLTFGKCKLGKWPDYLELGLTREHVPDLIRMATEPELDLAESESVEVWAQVHAWRALGQLQAEEAIKPLMARFEEDDESDWISSELPRVYAMIGPVAIPALTRYLAEDSHGLYARATAANSLKAMGKSHPEAREECVAALTRQLEQADENDPELNGYLIANLMDLKAVEAMPVIRAAFEKEAVDLFVVGDLEDVETEFGLRPPQFVPRARVTLPDGTQQKVGRNDPCPCGSGKKYKKCCLNKSQ